MPFPQKLWVPCQLSFPTDRSKLSKSGRQALSRAHGHSGLSNHQARPLEERAEGLDARFDVAEVGGQSVPPLRGASADEEHVTVRGGLRVGIGKPQLACFNVLAEHWLQVWFEKRKQALRQGVHLC